MQLEYIKEINNPSVQFANEGSNHLACQRYLNYLEQLRVSFVEYIGLCENAEILGLLGELEAAKNAIDKYGFAEIGQNEITALLLSGIPGMDSKAQALQDYKTLFKGILNSITKTITFINTVLSGQSANVREKAQIEDKDDGNQKEPISKPLTEREWLTLDEVCDEFRLSKNNVKSRQWRINNGFPTGNAEPYGRLVFSRSEVMAWRKAQKC